MSGLAPMGQLARLFVISGSYWWLKDLRFIRGINPKCRSDVCPGMPSRRSLYVTRTASISLALLSATAVLAQPAPVKSDEKPGAPSATAEERTVQLERRLEAAESRASTAEKTALEVQSQLKALETQAAEAKSKQQDLATRVEEAEKSAQANQETIDAAAEHADEVEPLRLYGFADMGWKVIRADAGTAVRNLIDTPNQFALGNANLYLDAQPSSRFRTLMEIRFTTYPGGTYAGAQATTPTNTTIMDINSPTGRNKVQWSGIILEREQLEYKHSDALALTVGYFLTPYGIWNVDHGTPTLISLALPTFFASEYFPTHSLGVQFSGSTASESVELGYRAYITNGRSPVQGDIDKNKNIGGRLYLTFTGDNPLTLGMSGFTGTYKEITKDLNITRNPPIQNTTTEAFNEWGIGADLSWDRKPFRLRVEWVGNQTTYEAGKRPLAVGGYAPNEFQWNAYTILAYQLPIWYLEPYVYAEYLRKDQNVFTQLISRGSSTASLGVNVNFSPTVKLKAQYFRVNFYDKEDGHISGGFSAFDSRLVTVF